jgi:hypothetical protein
MRITKTASRKRRPKPVPVKFINLFAFVTRGSSEAKPGNAAEKSQRNVL